MRAALSNRMKSDFASLFTILLASSTLMACGSVTDDDSGIGGQCSGYPTERTESFDYSTKKGTCGSDDAGAASTSDAGTGNAADAGATSCTCEVVCKNLMSQTPKSCRFTTGTGVECTVSQICPGGRKPELLVAPELPFTDRRTAFLLGSAHMEAASVVAFERLACEMAFLGAPSDLLERLRAAAADEVRHARDMLSLAGDHPLPRVDAPSPGQRTAYAVALENAREGCVRETFAALLARRQAVTACDASVRAIMSGIAADETRHAELSWELAAWLDRQLDADQREELSAARTSEASKLRAELTAGGLLEDAELGLPGAREAVALLDGLFGELTRGAA